MVRQGMRRGYTTRESNLTALRGRLLVAVQMRHNLLSPDRFHTRHDVFTADRAENRLIHAALHAALAQATTQANRSHARQLLPVFMNVPPCRDIGGDMAQVRICSTITTPCPGRSSCWKPCLP
mgnify:CR=1 FL=1